MIVEDIINNCQRAAASAAHFGTPPPVLVLPVWLAEDIRRLADEPEGSVPAELGGLKVVVEANAAGPGLLDHLGKVASALSSDALRDECFRRDALAASVNRQPALAKAPR